MSDLYRLTPRALSDLDDIADYTIETWGIEQLDVYLGQLTDRVEWLAKNQLLGRARDDIHPGYRCFPEGSHKIFYVIRDEYVDVIGIPHKSMDVGPVFFLIPIVS